MLIDNWFKCNYITYIYFVFDISIINAIKRRYSLLHTAGSRSLSKCLYIYRRILFIKLAQSQLNINVLNMLRLYRFNMGRPVNCVYICFDFFYIYIFYFSIYIHICIVFFFFPIYIYEYALYMQLYL